MRKIYIDMDGTLVEFDKSASLEQITSPGYFSERPAMKNMVEAVDKLLDKSSILGLDINILTSVFNDTHSKADKRKSVEAILPRLKEKIIFVPYGENKSDYIGECNSSDILLDDFSANLHSWKGIGIKVLNGINNTKRTWKGFIVNADSDADVIYKTIVGILFATPKKEDSMAG